MSDEKTFAELETQAQAMISALTAQRNAAQDQCINLLGQLAILEMRLKALAPVPAPSEEIKSDG